MHKPVEDEIHDIMSRVNPEKNVITLKLPKHVTLSITHNGHKSVYETVEQYTTGGPGNWVPGDSRQRAYESDEMWEVQWYPETPVGFCLVYGHTLQEILDYING